MATRESLVEQISEEIVRSQDATVAFDEAASAVLALDRRALSCLAHLLYGGAMPLDALGARAGLVGKQLRSVVERLELAGYARRATRSAGRREVHLELTEHARKWIGAIWGPLGAEAQRLLGPLSDQELAFLHRFLSESRAVQERHTARVRALLEVPGASRAARMRGGLSPAALRRVQLFVEANLGRQIALAELAERAGLSAFHFARAFKQSVGSPPLAWLQQRRVERAHELLRTTDLPLGEVALATGFGSQSHFTTVFRRLTGLTPAVVRRGSR